MQQDILVNNLPTYKTTVNRFPIFYPQQLIEQKRLNYHCCIFLQIILYEMKFNSEMNPLNGRAMKTMLDFKSFDFRDPNLISATGASRRMCQMPSREPSWIELFSADSAALRHRIPRPIMCAPVKITSIYLNSSPAGANRSKVPNDINATCYHMRLLVEHQLHVMWFWLNWRKCLKFRFIFPSK